MLTGFLTRYFGYRFWRRTELRSSRKYECCRRGRNMRAQDSGRNDMSVERCRVCGRTFRIVLADPASLASFLKLSKG